MNQPLSRIRLLVLASLLVAETALALSLRTSGWIGTGQAIRSLMIGVAIVLPFVMTAVLLYRVRVRLRRGQISLRALMALTIVVASYLALLPLFAKPDKQNTGPLPISNSVKFEVFKVAATGTSIGPSFTDPDTGTTLRVTTPPIITGADVSTIQLTTRNEGQHYAYLSIVLRPAGGNKLLKATTAANVSQLVVVIDGQVLTVPKVFAPVSGKFRLTGKRIDTEGNDVFNALTR